MAELTIFWIIIKVIATRTCVYKITKKQAETILSAFLLYVTALSHKTAIGRLSAGTTWNIIAEDAVLEGTVRALSNETQALLIEKMTETARSVAALYGATAEVEIEPFTPAVINSDTAFEEARKAAADLVGAENVITDQRLLFGFGADDFAEFLQHADGVYVHVGTANDSPASRVPLHSELIEPDEGALSIAARLHINYALSVLRG